MTGGTGNSIYSAGVSYLPNSDLDESYDSVNGSWKYTYDDFNRLNTAVSNTGLGCAEVYDRFGNRLQQTNYTGTCMTPNYTLQTGKYWISGFSYDLAGDMIGDGIHSYQYDAEGRLASVDSGSTATYVYDAGGTRVRRITGGLTYDDVHDLGGRVISDFIVTGSTGTWNRGEVYAGGMHLATYTTGATGNTYFVHSDWLGTERVRSTAGGAIYSTWTSYPFGEGSSTPNPTGTFFTGKVRDLETGDDYFGARYYNSAMGRFMSPDWSATPSGVPYAQLGDPQSLNLYGYVRNNPLIRVDLDGHIMIDGVDIGNSGLAGNEESTEGIEAQNKGGQNNSQAQQNANRQPDGSYKATDAQLAQLNKAADTKATIGNGECVTACERFTGVPGPTSAWRGGKPASELTDKDKGTAIATFQKGADGQWHYLPDADGHKNSGTFMGTSTKGTFWMADQWPGQKPVSTWNIGNNPNNASMNATSYRVIIVPNP